MPHVIVRPVRSSSVPLLVKYFAVWVRRLPQSVVHDRETAGTLHPQVEAPTRGRAAGMAACLLWLIRPVVVPETHALEVLREEVPLRGIQQLPIARLKLPSWLLRASTRQPPALDPVSLGDRLREA